MFLFCKEVTFTFLKKFVIYEKLESSLALFCRNGRWQKGYWEGGIYSHKIDRKEMACCWRGISLKQKLAGQDQSDLVQKTSPDKEYKSLMIILKQRQTSSQFCKFK